MGVIIILLSVSDILTTIFQAFLITWSCNNTASKENKIPKLKFWVLVFIISALIIGFSFSNFQILYVKFIMVLAPLLMCIIFYKKSIIDGVIGFGVAYAIIVMASYLLITFYEQVIVKINLQISSDIQIILFVYIPAWLIYVSVFAFKKYIFNAILYMKTYSNSLVFFIIYIYTLIVLDTSHGQIESKNVDTILKSMFYFILFLIFIFVIVYFARVNEKSKEVEMLNVALQEIITELKKVKHDYGSEISSFYGLYQLGKIERLGEMLKNVVEKGRAIDTSVYLNMQATPLVNSILTPIACSNIDIIVSDIADYENLDITDDELLRILSNITRNSVDVLKEVMKPIIKFKSYNTYNGVAITISNNGPEIPKEIKDRMFESGFSTKDNFKGDRGYGLSIVDDIIRKCAGKITINSNKELTQFNIEIPFKTIIKS